MDFRSDYQNIDIEYCRAGSSLRLTNYIIDLISYYVFMLCLGFFIGIVKPSLLGIFDNGLISRIISLVLYGVFMSFTEGMSNGMSIGKLITKTKAVNLDGSEINFGKAFQRNIIRAIPFNVFSAFGNPCNPWHDRLSDTMVIEYKKLVLEKNRTDLFNSFEANP